MIPSAPLRAGVPVHRGRAGDAVRREADRVVEPDHVAQHLLAVEQRQAGEVDPLVEEAVEEIELDGHAGQRRARLVPQVHPLLQPREGREAGLRIGRHDLAVEHRVAPHRLRESLHQLGIAALHRLPVARHQADRSSGDEDQHPHAVQLRLVDPAWAGGHLVAQRRQHRREPARLRPVPQPAPIADRAQARAHSRAPAPTMASRFCLASRMPSHGSPSRSSRSGTVSRVKSVG